MRAEEKLNSHCGEKKLFMIYLQNYINTYILKYKTCMHTYIYTYTRT
jgi:hypothetical protein